MVIINKSDITDNNEISRLVAKIIRPYFRTEFKSAQVAGEWPSIIISTIDSHNSVYTFQPAYKCLKKVRG